MEWSLVPWSWAFPWCLVGEEGKNAIATDQELTRGQNAWSRGEESKHAMATGQELTPGQNAWSRGEEGKHAMATGQELTPGQNASLDIMINKFSPKPMSNLWKKGRL